MYDAQIKQHPLFAALSPPDMARALQFFQARQETCAKGAYLNRAGAPLARFGLVLSGSVQVYMDDMNGDHMIMANVAPGDTFGESLCFLGVESPVSIEAVSDAVILFMNPAQLRLPPADDLAEKLRLRFTAMLARRTLSMNDRIQILSKGSLRAKLFAFFSQCVQRQGTSFQIPFNRQDLATYLGVNRSALSRELAKLQQEGVIHFHKNQFHILSVLSTAEK